MSPSLALTGIQSVLYWENRLANLRMLEEKIDSIASPTGIVILPEMFSTGFSMKPTLLAETMQGETVHWMKNVAANKKIILTGSLIIEENGNYFNRLVWMQPDGEYAVYDKRHLFAYGEEHKHYTAGTKRLITSVNGWRINLQVCYDLRFPVWARQSPASGKENAGMEYDVLIYVANWPEKRIHAWKTLLQARAIENQCYVIGLNRIGDDGNAIHYSGESRVIDPLGEILYTSKDKEDIFTVKLDKTQLDDVRKKFPFWKDADGFKITDNSK